MEERWDRKYLLDSEGILRPRERRLDVNHEHLIVIQSVPYSECRIRGTKRADRAVWWLSRLSEGLPKEGKSR